MIGELVGMGIGEQLAGPAGAVIGGVMGEIGEQLFTKAVRMPEPEKSGPDKAADNKDAGEASDIQPKPVTLGKNSELNLALSSLAGAPMFLSIPVSVSPVRVS
ncbi:hypothetical protein BjapCC829_48870 (plasmid) [Bradyrhizobium barranii]|uniref:Uncharacterized protein n=1 Tax=Bradyrhizobium barranii TaxID=2992140 RepID=A0ABY3R205_9BRAD|nr:hypothetical protein [Bradyrhizobium japonicum]UFW92152.1 hypothetical protein BjapCC829_48870 [Bradyrhizobium japonicum]